MAPLLLPACRAEQAGAVMVAMQTDMVVPKDVTHVGVFVSYDGQIKMARVVKVDAETENGRVVRLPSTLAVVSSKDFPDARVRVRVMAFQAQSGEGETALLRARVARDAKFTIPKERRVLLRMPLQFINDGSASGEARKDGVLNLASRGLRFSDAIDTDTGLGAFEFRCKDDKTSVLGDCVPSDIDASALPDFFEEDVFGRPGQPGAACFPAGAFARGATADVVPNGDGCAAVLTVDDAVPDTSLNVGFISADKTGDCNTPFGGCVIPADGPGSQVPFYTVERSAPGKRTARFPKGVCAKLGAKVAYATGTAPKTEKMSVCSGGAAPTAGVDGGGTSSSCVELWSPGNIEDLTLDEPGLSGIGLAPTLNRIYYVKRGADSSEDYFVRYVTPGSLVPSNEEFMASFPVEPTHFSLVHAGTGRLAIAVHGQLTVEKLGLVREPDGTVFNAVVCNADPCPNQGATDLRLLGGGPQPDVFWFGAAGLVQSIGVSVAAAPNAPIQLPPMDLADGGIFDPKAIGLSDVAITGGGFVPSSTMGQRRFLGSAAGAVLCDWPSFGNCETIAGAAGGSVLASASYWDPIDKKGELFFLRSEGGLSRVQIDEAGKRLPGSTVSVQLGNRGPFKVYDSIVLDGPNVFLTSSGEIVSPGPNGEVCPVYLGKDVRDLVLSADRYMYFTEPSGNGRKIRRYKLKDIGAR
jgi:hypothetical protein